MPRRYSMGSRGNATERTRTRIRTALVKLLGQKAYGSITMANIAEEADVSVRTVQRHYGSKDDVLAAACRHSAQWLTEELSRGPPGRSPEEAVGRLVRAQFEYYRQHDGECWAVYSRSADVPEVQKSVRAAAAASAAPVEALIARWPQAWAVDRQTASTAILALTTYPAWRGFTDFSGLGSEEAVALVTDLLCRALLRH